MTISDKGYTRTFVK